VRWDGFRATCPQIAELAAARFARDELVLLGTIRADGSARISPCEVDIAAERLCLGMMWQSRKALDLIRDDRIAVHSLPAGRMNPDGDIKLTGHAVEETDLGIRDEYRSAIKARIDWAPDEPSFHLFSLDVGEASFIRFGEEPLVWAWDAAHGFRELPHPDEPAGG
jgi:hypothetical protein